MLTLSIPGDPVGKGRPRVTVRAGHAHAYTPQRTAAWESGAAWLMRNEWGIRAPYEGIVRVTVEAVASRPKRLLRKGDPEGRMWRPAKPDADNVLKAVLDALVNAGVLRDDVQAVEVIARSWYASKGEGPSVEVNVQPMREEGR